MTITMNSAHSPSFPSLHLHHSSFSNPSITLPTSQLILQPFHCFTYITAHSPTLPSLYQHHSSFSNPSLKHYYYFYSFASPMSQALQLIHLASYPCIVELLGKKTVVLIKLHPMFRLLLRQTSSEGLCLRRSLHQSCRRLDLAPLFIACA